MDFFTKKDVTQGDLTNKNGDFGDFIGSNQQNSDVMVFNQQNPIISRDLASKHGDVIR